MDGWIGMLVDTGTELGGMPLVLSSAEHRCSGLMLDSVPSCAGGGGSLGEKWTLLDILGFSIPSTVLIHYLHDLITLDMTHF